jgi:hypothetical protein
MATNKGGRPRKVLTDEQKKQVEGLASVLTQEQLADYFGMCRTAFNELMKREPDVYALYARGRSKAVAMVGKSLLQQALDGDASQQRFYLVTQGGWRESKAVEVTGKEGGAIELQIGTDAAFNALAGLLGSVIPSTQGGSGDKDDVARDGKA